jgi:hypothetical protein
MNLAYSAKHRHASEKHPADPVKVGRTPRIKNKPHRVTLSSKREGQSHNYPTRRKDPRAHLRPKATIDPELTYLLRSTTQHWLRRRREEGGLISSSIMPSRYERCSKGAEGVQTVPSRFSGKDERGRVASVAARWRECLQLQGVRGLSPKHCVRMRCIPEGVSLFVSFECDSLSRNRLIFLFSTLQLYSQGGMVIVLTLPLIINLLLIITIHRWQRGVFGVSNPISYPHLRFWASIIYGKKLSPLIFYLVSKDIRPTLSIL